MCIIVYKPSGIELPAKEILSNCFKHNSDGAGYMYPENGSVHIEKGFFNFESLWDFLSKKDWKEIPLVLHFRIATSGGVSGAMCHPFPMAKEMNKFKECSVDTLAGIAHNGVFLKLGNKEYSDTVDFIMNYLAPCEKFIGHKGFDKMMELVMDSSKLIIMYADGLIKSYGKWIHEGGIYYSNTTYSASYTYIWDDDDYDYCHGRYRSYKESDNSKLFVPNKLETDHSINCPRCNCELEDQVELFYGFCFGCLFDFGYDPCEEKNETECAYCTNKVFFSDDVDSKHATDENGLPICCDCAIEKANSDNTPFYGYCVNCGRHLIDAQEGAIGLCIDCYGYKGGD